METASKDEQILELLEAFSGAQRLIIKDLDYKENHLTKHQVYLLIALGRRQVMTMSKTAAIIGCSKEQATRLVAPLVETGLVERFHREENRKMVYIRLTEKGLDLMNEKKEKMEQRMKKNLGLLTQEEMNQFYHSAMEVARLIKILEQRQQEARMEAPLFLKADD